MNQFNQYQEEARRTLNTEVEAQYLLAKLGMGLAGEAGEGVTISKRLFFTATSLIQPESVKS